MKFPRRRFLQLAASAPALSVLGRVAGAQTYPSRPVLLLVGYAPGGVNDIVARLTGQMVAERLGQQFIIENRPGAGSNLATEAVVRANPDGYTLLEASTSNGWNATLYQNLKFDFIRDIAPVASSVKTYNVMIVNPAFPAKTVPEFIAYAKANPGKINMASAGAGSAPHVLGELFKTLAGVDLLHVPYRGNPLPELLSGQVQVFFGPIQSGIEYIRTGKLRALAVTTAARSEILPDVPVLSDFVPGYEASAWLGLGAPRNTPADIVERLNRETNVSLMSPEMKARFRDLGDTAFTSQPAEFGKLLASETEKWGKVIRSANIKAE